MTRSAVATAERDRRLLRSARSQPPSTRSTRTTLLGSPAQRAARRRPQPQRPRLPRASPAPTSPTSADSPAELGLGTPDELSTPTSSAYDATRRPRRRSSQQQRQRRRSSPSSTRVARRRPTAPLHDVDRRSDRQRQAGGEDAALGSTSTSSTSCSTGAFIAIDGTGTLSIPATSPRHPRPDRHHRRSTSSSRRRSAFGPIGTTASTEPGSTSTRQHPRQLDDGLRQHDGARQPADRRCSASLGGVLNAPAPATALRRRSTGCVDPHRRRPRSRIHLAKATGTLDQHRLRPPATSSSASAVSPAWSPPRSTVDVAARIGSDDPDPDRRSASARPATAPAAAPSFAPARASSTLFKRTPRRAPAASASTRRARRSRASACCRRAPLHDRADRPDRHGSTPADRSQLASSSALNVAGADIGALDMTCNGVTLVG